MPAKKRVDGTTRRPMKFEEFWETVGKHLSEDEEVTREQMPNGDSCIIYRGTCGEILGVYSFDEETGGFAWEN